MVGDRVFFGSSDRNVYGVNIDTGEEVWKFNTGGDVEAAPAVGEDVLVIGNTEAVYCFGAKPTE
jgi:outer membrane protein assembly factor BamB